MLLVHPDGLASKATKEEMAISFAPLIPDYAGIAKAASGGHIFAEKVDKVSELESVLKRAVESVQNGDRKSVV